MLQCVIKCLKFWCNGFSHSVYRFVLLPLRESHFRYHSISTDNQHGFRKKHSCETQLITTIHEVATNMSHKKEVDIQTNSETEDLCLSHGGKNKFCCDTLSQTHKIIYPRLLYKENPRFGIRDVALEAYKSIKEGHKVVILDTNENKKTRESYIRLLKKKVGNHLSFATVCILPKHGCQQLLWSQELYRAKRSQSYYTEHKNDYNSDDCDEEQILKWFENTSDTDVTYKHGVVDEVKVTEGSSVHHITNTLQAASRYKFDVPALFVQWECISGVLEADDEEADKMVTNIGSVFTLWANQNSHGRIIVVCDGSQIKTGEKSCSQQIRDIKEVLTRKVTSKIDVLLYVHLVEKPGASGSYISPPQPGILAFLQHRHCLDITAKNTLYIYETSVHKQLAEKAGVRHVKGSRLMKQPSLVTVGHIAVTPAIPEMLHHMTVVPDDGEHVEAKIPLYDLALEFHDHCIQRDLGRGRSEYLFAQDLETVERLQKLYASKARKIFEPESVIQLSYITNSPINSALDTSVISEYCITERDLPKWMMSKQDSSTSKPSLNTSLSLESIGQERKVRKSLYVMTEKELVEIATDILKQAGKQDVLDEIEKEGKRLKTFTDPEVVKHRLKQDPIHSPFPDLLDSSSNLFDKNLKNIDDFSEVDESLAKITSEKLKRQANITYEPEFAPTANKKSKSINDASCDLFESSKISMEQNDDVSPSGNRVLPGEGSGTSDIRHKSRSAFSSNITSTVLDGFLDTPEVRKPSPKKHVQASRKKGSARIDTTPIKQQNKKSSRHSPDLSVLDDIFL